MPLKKLKDKIVIDDYQTYYKDTTKHGHTFTFVHGKDHKTAKLFTVEVKHSDKIRGNDGRWKFL